MTRPAPLRRRRPATCFVCARVWRERGAAGSRPRGRRSSAGGAGPAPADRGRLAQHRGYPPWPPAGPPPGRPFLPRVPAPGSAPSPALLLLLRRQQRRTLSNAGIAGTQSRDRVGSREPRLLRVRLGAANPAVAAGGRGVGPSCGLWRVQACRRRDAAAAVVRWSRPRGPASPEVPAQPGCSPRGRPQLVRVGLQPTAPPPRNSRGREPGATCRGGLAWHPLSLRFPDRGDTGPHPDRRPRTRALGNPPCRSRSSRVVLRIPSGLLSPGPWLGCSGQGPNLCRLPAAPCCPLHQPDAERRAPLGRIRLPPSARVLALTVPGFEGLVKLLRTLVTGIRPLRYAHPAVGSANCTAPTSPG